MHSTQTDYAMQLARHDVATKTFGSKSAHLVYPENADSPEWERVFDAEEAIRTECHLDVITDLRSESEDRLIAWQLGVAREEAHGDAKALTDLDFIEESAWKPNVRERLLDLAMRLDVAA